MHKGSPPLWPGLLAGRFCTRFGGMVLERWQHVAQDRSLGLIRVAGRPFFQVHCLQGAPAGQNNKNGVVRVTIVGGGVLRIKVEGIVLISSVSPLLF